MHVKKAKRGCGYPQVGAFYVVGFGPSMVCLRLPIPIPPVCGCCGRPNKLLRAPQKIDGTKFPGPCESSDPGHECHSYQCPMCIPPEDWSETYLWDVGSKYYTPTSFLLESFWQGISKRLPPSFPFRDIIGKWVLLAHPEAVPPPPGEEGPHTRGVFHAFRASAVLYYIDESEYAELSEGAMRRYEERGITLVPVPDEDPDYHSGGNKCQLPDLDGFEEPVPDEKQSRLTDFL